MKNKGIFGGIIVVVLILVLTLAVGGGSVSAEEPTIIASGNCGKAGSNVTWTLDSTGLLTISGEGEMYDFSTYSGDQPWRSYVNKIESIVVESGISSVGNYVFYEHSALKSVTILGNVVSVGDGACYNCKNLTTVKFAGEVKSIGQSAFYICRNLISVNISDGITSIGSGAFMGCSKLEDIYLPETLLSIGERAFSSCRELTKITIPSSIGKIEKGAFENCSGLTEITIPEGITSIGEEGFAFCSWSTKVELPDSLRSIGYSAFRSCGKLKTINIPENVVNISGHAFDFCYGLEEINYNAKKVTTNLYKDSNVFYTSSQAKKSLRLTIGENVETIPDYLFANCVELTEVNYNAKAAETLGSSCFRKAGTAEIGFKVTFGGNVEKIPNSLFRSCENLTEVVLSNGIISIGQYAFHSCNGLTHVIIPENVKSIGKNAFYYCRNLKNITIYAKNMDGFSADDSVFSGAGSSGIQVVFGNTVECIPAGMFCGCYLTSVIIPESVTSIGSCAFLGCNKLNNIEIPNRVTQIGSSAFSGCSGLTSIDIPNSVTSVGSSAFSNCTGLTSAVISNSMTNIAESTFAGCASLTSITIPEGITNIGSLAFSGCKGLTSAKIPESILSIGSDAFADCDALQDIYFGSTEPIWRMLEVTTRVETIIHFAEQTGRIVFSGECGTSGNNVAWTINDRGVLTISGQGAMQDYEVKTVNGDIIITAPWYKYGKYISSVIIEVGVTSIGDSAFRGCGGLASVNIGNSVTSIGTAAFAFCTGLAGVTIPDSVTSIGSSAFYGCTGLSSVTIPDSVTSIGDRAFYGCTGLTEIIYNAEDAVVDSEYYIGGNVFINAGSSSGGLRVIIGDGVRKIPDYLFYGCTGLSSVTIGNSVTRIGDGAFSDCTGLTEIYYNAKAAANLKYDSYASFKNAGTSSKGLRLVIGDCVEHIPNYLFSSCTGLSSVTISDSVTSIGWSAFKGCIGLTSVTIGNSVTSVGSDAFSDCTGLTSVTIPDGVTSIGSGAFLGCTDLTSVTIGNSVTSVGSSAFSGCTGLTSVTIPNSVTSIEESVFSDCTGLSSVTIGDSVTSIGNRAFSGCSNLTSVYFNAKECTDFKENSDVFRYAGKKTEGMVITFGKNVQNIPSYLCYASEYNTKNWKYDYSPYYAPKVKKIIIADGVQDIGQFAFYGSTSLSEIIYNAKAAADLKSGSDVFSNAGTSSDGLRVVIGNSVEHIPAHLFSGCTGLTSMTIPDSVTSIGSGAFLGCTDLTSVTIGNSVTSIGSSAFSGCTGLTSVTIPNSVTSIEESVFSDCTGLTSVTIPNSVTSIGSSAFHGCTGLTSVTIPDSVTSIGSSAFHGCTGLTSVTIPDSVTSIGDGAFSYCTGLTEILYNAKAAADLDYYSNAFSNAGTSSDGLRAVIGNSVEQIPACLFSGCTGLTSVKIGNGVTSIGERAFTGCTGLTSVTIPDSVASIGNGAFYGCTGLTSVTIGNSVTSIGSEAFSGCTGLAGVTIGNSVASIGSDAFYGCTGLTSVTIPNSVTSIGDGAFSRCTGLTSVTIPSSVESIGSLAFSNCSQLKDIFYGGSELAWKLRFSNVSVSGNTTVHFEQPTGQILVSGNCGTDGDNLTWTINDRGNLTVSGKGAMKDYTQSYINYQYVNTSPWGNYAKCLYSAVIENGVTSIGDYAFAFCKNLKSVTIGEDVSNFGSCAFRECSNLEELNYNAKAAADLGTSEYVFDCAGNSGNGICVWVGERVKKIPRDLFCGAATYFSNHANLRCVFFKGNPPIIDGIGLVSSRSSVYAFYPYGNSEWTASARNSYGSKLIWSAYSDAPATAVSCKTNKTVYLVGETLDVSHLVMTVTHEDGCVETIPYASGLLTLGEYDLTTPGAKSIPVTGRGAEGKLSVYVHEQKTETLDKAGYPESSHDYENDLNKTYTYKAEGAFSLDVTFSAQTEVETNIDYLYVNGTKYTGTELAGKTITISGDTLTIRLVSDKSDSAYGFSIDSIVMTYMGHEYEDTVVPPTCTEQGYTLRSCPCGSVVKQNYVDALGHDMVTDAAVAPTCTKTGLTEGSHCARCDEATTAQKVVPALGHDMVTDAAVAPTCMKTGLTEGSHCSRCDEATTAQKVVPALGHDMVTDAAVAPTCTKTGLTEGSHCSRCDEATTAQKVVPALGHDMVTDAAVAPTCTKTGLTEGSHCARCDEATTAQKVVPALGHDMVTDAAVAPTCTKTGLTEGSHCNRCDETIVEQKVVPALGHDMVTDAAVAPTCTKTGLTEGSHCSRCDEATTAQKVVPALGHDMVTDAAVAPTCTKTGLTEGSHCSRCDDQTTAQEVIPARGHRFNARHICMVCGVEDPVVEITLKKLPTKASYVVNKEALDVAGGVVLAHYESGETEELELTAAMVSGFDNTILGKQTLTVTVGGLTTTFEVEVVERAVTFVAVENGKLVKHYTDGTTEETPLKDGAISDFAISETGEKTLTLTSENACVAAYKDADGNYVALKAVANEDGSYSYVVPEEVTEVTVAVKGDLDGDGRINMKDLAQLRRNMAEGTVEGGLEQLLIDFNGDGVVNMKDMGILRRYLAGGYGVELGW